MSTQQVDWHNKPWLLALLTLVLPLIALVGLWLNTNLPRPYKIVLALAALVNFLGQVAIIVQYLLQ